jgi:hypothetical protein
MAAVPVEIELFIFGRSASHVGNHRHLGRSERERRDQLIGIQSISVLPSSDFAGVRISVPLRNDKGFG